MRSDYLDPTTPRYQLPFEQLPRGFVAFPQIILDHLEKEQERMGFRFAEDYVRRSLEHQTLSYFYDGLDVAYRPAKGGIEVLGLGCEETASYRKDPTVKVIQA
jgi:hypothetical protein